MKGHPGVTEMSPCALFILSFQSAVHRVSFSPGRALKTHQSNFRPPVLTYSVLREKDFHEQGRRF